MIKVEAILHQDVRGKELKYLKLTKGTESVLINVGDKTYEAVKKLTEEQKEQIGEAINTLAGKPIKK